LIVFKLLRCCGNRQPWVVVPPEAESAMLSRQSTAADLRTELAERSTPVMLEVHNLNNCRSCLDRTVSKFSALLSAAVCYVAATAWILVAYGEMGLDASDERPIHGWDLASFSFALICVTAICYVGVYKLQKMKYRAVQVEVQKMHDLMGSNVPAHTPTKTSDAQPSSVLDTDIPSLPESFRASESSRGSCPRSTTHDDMAVYKELLVRKLRAEGMQQGSGMITDACEQLRCFAVL
jgi:hypothetical protein